MPDTDVRALVRRARRNFPQTPTAPRSAVRHNRKAWVRAVLQLGDRWVLADRSTFQGFWTPAR